MHGHGHDHQYHSHHDRHGPHGHVPKDFSTAFAIGIILNIAYIIIEVIYGLIAGSMALLADAGHNLSDVLGLIIAWVGSVLAKKPPTKRFTFGLGGSSILAALLNALLLLVAVGAIAWEAISRFQDPAPVSSETVIWVASVGIAINFGTALLFMRGQKDDINVRGAFLHMMADAGVSAAVVVGGIIIFVTGMNWVDPLISLIVVAIIFWSTWGLLKESVSMTLAGVPSNIDAGEVQEYLENLPDVAAVHDVHIWPMSTSETALTAHLIIPSGHPGGGFLANLQDELLMKFAIHHMTIQIELEDEEAGVCKNDCG